MKKSNQKSKLIKKRFMFLEPQKPDTNLTAMFKAEGKTHPHYRDSFLARMSRIGTALIVEEKDGPYHVVYNLAYWCRDKNLPYSSTLKAFRRDGTYRYGSYLLKGCKLKDGTIMLFDNASSLEAVQEAAQVPQRRIGAKVVRMSSFRRTVKPTGPSKKARLSS